MDSSENPEVIAAVYTAFPPVPPTENKCPVKLDLSSLIVTRERHTNLTFGDSDGPFLVLAARLSIEIVRVVGRGGVLQCDVSLQPAGAFPQCYRYPAVQDLV